MRSKKIFILVLTFLLVNSAFSQTYLAQVKPMGSKDWGYINIDGGVRTACIHN